jgi:hypothetical protein
MPSQSYSRIEPLSETELAWAQRFFDATHDSDWLPAEDEAIKAERDVDERFATVADYIFRWMYRDPEAPPPSPEQVDYAATVFQRIAPNWWRTMRR